MTGETELNWYLVNTKPQRERWVANQLAGIASDVFLPLLRGRAPRWGRMAQYVGPLFPCYVFARFDLQARYFDVKYLQGVKCLVSAGREVLAVPSPIVEQIRRRTVDGIAEIEPKPIGRGERVTVVDGPFKGFDAIFERYLSSAERVAILLNAVSAAGVRMILPAGSVSKSL